MKRRDFLKGTLGFLGIAAVRPLSALPVGPCTPVDARPAQVAGAALHGQSNFTDHTLDAILRRVYSQGNVETLQNLSTPIMAVFDDYELDGDGFRFPMADLFENGRARS